MRSAVLDLTEGRQEIGFRTMSLGDQSGDVVTPCAPERSRQAPSRRDVVGRGVKLAFVAPLLSTFFAADAYAANYSCYLNGHVCTPILGAEPCCSGMCHSVTLKCFGDGG